MAEHVGECERIWDEMGQGEERGMHGKLLHEVNEHFGIKPNSSEIISEALQLSNVMTAFAVHRRYAFQSVGALGVIEMTAPGRVSLVDQGLARLGVEKSKRRYFTLHATLDIKHSREWNREVIEPLWDHAGRAIAEGAYIRLALGEQCFKRYARHLGLDF
jgi:pyrroloquinoline quinone (PQQ) biosynthesis protein C